MTAENSLQETEIQLSPLQSKWIERERNKLFGLLLSVPTPEHDKCPGGNLTANQIKLNPHLSLENGILRIKYEPLTPCANVSNCGLVGYFLFNFETNQWERPEKFRGLPSNLLNSLGYSRPEGFYGDSDDENDLFKRLGGSGKLK